MQDLVRRPCCNSDSEESASNHRELAGSTEGQEARLLSCSLVFVAAAFGAAIVAFSGLGGGRLHLSLVLIAVLAGGLSLYLNLSRRRRKSVSPHPDARSHAATSKQEN